MSSSAPAPAPAPAAPRVLLNFSKHGWMLTARPVLVRLRDPRDGSVAATWVFAADAPAPLPQPVTAALPAALVWHALPQFPGFDWSAADPPAATPRPKYPNLTGAPWEPRYRQGSDVWEEPASAAAPCAPVVTEAAVAIRARAVATAFAGADTEEFTGDPAAALVGLLALCYISVGSDGSLPFPSHVAPALFFNAHSVARGVPAGFALAELGQRVAETWNADTDPRCEHYPLAAAAQVPFAPACTYAQLRLARQVLMHHGTWQIFAALRALNTPPGWVD